MAFRGDVGREVVLRVGRPLGLPTTDTRPIIAELLVAAEDVLSSDEPSAGAVTACGGPPQERPKTFETPLETSKGILLERTHF